ncbi:hypothetical protein CEXT_798611 [Caerostris extrusa]|uniref:Uncharacterized protein n=1 Tax=Caerostris extrusa TaxID=172846 RepID=A0AAV4Q598_CAEEX|nr:hypothetical protein CEXT_798611 [Caerostris extrusa]
MNLELFLEHKNIQYLFLAKPNFKAPDLFGKRRLSQGRPERGSKKPASTIDLHGNLNKYRLKESPVTTYHARNQKKGL